MRKKITILAFFNRRYSIIDQAKDLISLWPVYFATLFDKCLTEENILLLLP